MNVYPPQLIQEAHRLRSQGKTYKEIRTLLGKNIPKATLSFWCKGIDLPAKYSTIIKQLNDKHLQEARQKALIIRKEKQKSFFESLEHINSPISEKIHEIEPAKIALAMLCLGEASKYNPKTTATFSLGSSNAKIIVIFLALLKQCYPFSIDKVRCTVQCRADQDPEKLKEYWKRITDIPDYLFYKAQIDPRTKGKPTKNPDYKGVLRVDYFDRQVQLDLESLANLVYNQLHTGS